MAFRHIQRPANRSEPGVHDERQHITHLENIRNASTKAELQRLYLAALSAAEAIGDAVSIKAFIAAKDKRYKELV